MHMHAHALAHAVENARICAHVHTHANAHTLIHMQMQMRSEFAKINSFTYEYEARNRHAQLQSRWAVNATAQAKPAHPTPVGDRHRAGKLQRRAASAGAAPLLFTVGMSRRRLIQAGAASNGNLVWQRQDRLQQGRRRRGRRQQRRRRRRRPDLQGSGVGSGGQRPS